MSTTDGSPLTATVIAKKIIVKTAELNVPLTPKNYHVWYEYFLGTNRDLSNAVDGLIDAGEGFHGEICEKLYAEHVGRDQSDLLKEVQKEAHKLFQNIFKATLSTTDVASDYSGKMEAYGNKLSAAEELTQIQDLVAEIISDTNKMAESSKTLSRQLDQATSQIQTLSTQLEKTEREVLLDALTGLNNRKAFDLKIDELVKGFDKCEEFFSVVMLDIDHFKKFNDQYGHQIGDEVLSLVGWHLKENLKGRDFPARYGGEEFIILLTNTKVAQATIVADNIRAGLSKKRLKIKRTGQTLGNITVSAGVSQIQQGDTAASVVQRADAALYLAKDSGRNAVRSEGDLESD